MNPNDLLIRAQRAAAAASALLELDDAIGASSRAYYSMFDTARAALILADAPFNVEANQSHGRLQQQFGLHIVKAGLLAPEWGRRFNRAYVARQSVEYSGSLDAPIDQARELAEQAHGFVQEVRHVFHNALEQTKLVE